jgi:ERCC4-type nuclease
VKTSKIYGTKIQTSLLDVLPDGVIIDERPERAEEVDRLSREGVNQHCNLVLGDGVVLEDPIADSWKKPCHGFVEI